MNAIDRIRQKLHPIFVKECICSAVLFGSFAKSAEQENSDVDIVIDSNSEIVPASPVHICIRDSSRRPAC